jgi:hypothetical protein
MNGLKNLQKVLRGAGQRPETLAFADGTRILVLPHGGRLLGVFPAGSDKNFYWTNTALESVAKAKAFFAGSAWHNSGGDRTWLAPEVDVFLPKFPDLTVYDQPRALDPGNYRVIAKGGSFGLENKLSIRLSRSKKQVSLKIFKSFGPAPDPLRYERGLNLSGVSYAGYSQFTSMAFEGSRPPAGARVGLWNLIQMPHGGELMLPTFSRTEPLHIFSTVGRIPKSAVNVSDHLVRYRMNQPGEHKLSFRARSMAGRAGYIVGAGDDWALVLRNFSINPSGEYVDVPWTNPGWQGFAVQACNVNSGLGSFSELEYHIPAIGEGTGHASCEDHAQVWAYRGPKEKIAAIAKILVAGSGFRIS